MNQLQEEIIRAAIAELDRAPHGAKAAVVERCAEALGRSVKRTYALLQSCRAAISQPARRVRRSDAGASDISDEELSLIGGILFDGRRQNNKAMWSIKRVIEVLHADRELSRKWSASHVARRLRQTNRHPVQISAPSPSVSMRTEHPNELWQIDASVCVLFRTPRGEVELMEREAFYKNKLANVAKVMTDLVVRYVVTDHASGCVGVRFYLGGETTENALQFLMWAISQRSAPDGRAVPFHGVPLHLYTDQGGAFKSGLFANFCQALEIDLQHHKPRNARATGSVENAQNLVERGMEGILRFLDPASITMSRLDEIADLWMHAFNGVEKHGRHGMTRYGAWLKITADQLRTAPPMDVLRSMPGTKPKQCTVSNDLRISFAVKGHGSNDYDVRNVYGATPRGKVMVTVNPFKAPAVNVGIADPITGDIIEWHTVNPIQCNEFGFDINAPRFGEFRSMPATPVDARRDEMARQAYATADGPATLAQAASARRKKVAPYLGQFNPLADLEAVQVPTYIPRQGSPLRPQVRDIKPAVLNLVDACRRIKANPRCAAFYAPWCYSHVAAAYPEGVPESELEAICADLARIAAERGLDDEGPISAVGGAR